MIHKPVRYFEIYEKYFAKFKDTECKVLEIGVENGGSLLMWRDYFGLYCEIIGIDINPKCKQFESEQIKVYIGDQADTNFLDTVLIAEGYFDIIIDDGGHHSFQQKASFKHLYKSLSVNGIYLCEDIGTNYWKEYGGGLYNPDTFVEMCKNMTDEIQMTGSEFSRITRGISFHADMIVFERGSIDNYETLQIGVKCV